MASRKRRRAGGLDEGVDVPAEQRKRCVVTGACRGRACSTSNSALRSPANAPPALVTFAAKDKASNVTLSKDSTTVSCTKGFRSVRSTLGVCGGCWYAEMVVPDRAKAGSHLRLGWAADKADPQCPPGTDGWGYAFRDISGSKVHQGVRHWFGRAYGAGDVIGLLIHFPAVCWEAPPTPPSAPPPQAGAGIAPDSIPLEWVRHLQQGGGGSGLPDGTPITVNPAPLPPLPSTPPPAPAGGGVGGDAAAPPTPPSWTSLDPPVHSYIRFYVNGEDQGIAFVNLTGSVGGPTTPGAAAAVADVAAAVSYHAVAGVMGSAAVRLNPGPDFAFPPPLEAPLRPAGRGGGDTAPGPAFPQPWMPLNVAHDVWSRRQVSATGTGAAPIDMAVHVKGLAAAAAAVAPSPSPPEAEA